MAKWKPVTIDTDGDFDGLVAIEKLENYEEAKIIQPVNIHVFHTISF